MYSYDNSQHIVYAKNNDFDHDNNANATEITKPRLLKIFLLQKPSQQAFQHEFSIIYPTNYSFASKEAS